MAGRRSGWQFGKRQAQFQISRDHFAGLAQTKFAESLMSPLPV